MNIQHLKANYTDERGEIRDLLIHKELDAVTYITSVPGAVRGNHYHEKSIQWDYILRGSYECYTRAGANGELEMEIVREGDLIEHGIGERHALKALEDSAMLSLSRGPRKGDEYENDVVRLMGDELLIS